MRLAPARRGAEYGQYPEESREFGGFGNGGGDCELSVFKSRGPFLIAAENGELRPAFDCAQHDRLGFGIGEHVRVVYRFPAGKFPVKEYAELSKGRFPGEPDFGAAFHRKAFDIE